MTDVTVAITVQPDVRITVGDVSSVSLLYTGAVAYTVTAGEALSYGDICYIKAADGKAYKAKSNGTAAEAEAQIICRESAGILINVSGLFAALGGLSALSGGTAGSIAYLSTTYGASTTTPPTTGYSKIIGRWLSSTFLHFQPDWATMQLS